MRGRHFAKSSFHYAWNPVRIKFGKPGMDFYELKHFGCTYWLDEKDCRQQMWLSNAATPTAAH